MTISLLGSRLAKLTVAAFFVAIAQPGLGQQPKHKPISVKTPDGLTISAQEWGNPNGPEILFIHGFSQSHLSWLRQVRSELAKSFRMITYDIRGHGGSDKPLTPEYYQDPKRWGDEVNAVMKGAQLKHPVLVGWSYGWRSIAEYLMHYGDGNIAGIKLVVAFTTGASAF